MRKDCWTNMSDILNGGRWSGRLQGASTGDDVRNECGRMWRRSFQWLCGDPVAAVADCSSFAPASGRIIGREDQAPAKKQVDQSYVLFSAPVIVANDLRLLSPRFSILLIDSEVSRRM